MQTKSPGHTGALILNADDWGRDTLNTDRTLECLLAGGLSSVSAMVFMEDSERGARIARERGIDAGLHLNLTSPFTAPGVPARLREHHERVSRYLGRFRFAQVVYHPGLSKSFEYVVAAQCEEFARLYGWAPQRIDGHHHMHQCANVVLGGLLPAGTIVRRNFTFATGEKSFANRFYRRMVDDLLARRHRMTDHFFSLEPVEPQRLARIFALAKSSVVEVETHPVAPEEYEFLRRPDLAAVAGSDIAARYALA